MDNKQPNNKRDDLDVSNKAVGYGNISVNAAAMRDMKKEDFVKTFRGKSNVDLNLAFKELKIRAKKS